MVSLTSSEAAILGLLAERPMHGYDLDSVIEQRGLRAWTEIGFSSIYFLLQKLEKKGLVRREGAPASPKGRNPYSITDDGRISLVRASLDFIAAADPPRATVLIGLAHWPMLDTKAALLALASRRERVAANLEALRSRRKAQSSIPPFVDALFSYGIAHAEAELVWLGETILRLGATDGED